MMHRVCTDRDPFVTGEVLPDIVILTGAGISAESGIGTFRDKGGIWSQYDVKDVATPEGFARNPDLVYEFYNKRRAKVRDAKPNAAHLALAELERRHDVLIVTQNVDDLHEKAGSEAVLHMHGAHNSALCAACGARWAAPAVLSRADTCKTCHANAVRPDVVWFGEMPYHLEQIAKALTSARMFVSIGTSGHVYPAAGFASEARAAGAYCLELNLEATEISEVFHESRRGPASAIVRDWVRELTG